MQFALFAINAIVGAISFLPQSTDANSIACISNVDSNKDYFPDKISPKYSQKWNITYHNTYKILTNKEVGTSYLMYQCGTAPPASEQGKHAHTFSVPLEDGVVVSGTRMIPHIEQLGLRRQVKAYLGDPQYISSPCMSTLVQDEDLIKTVYDPYSFSNLGQDLDDFLVEKENVLILRDSSTETPNLFVISDTNEAESLDIYEWHKVYGALFNLEATANEQFEEAEARYQCSTDNAAYISEQKRLVMTETEKPTIVWAYHSTWSTPNYWDVVTCDESNLYYCEYAQRCAATLLHSNNGTISSWTPGDYHMNDEEFFEFAKDADHWIYASDNWDVTFDRFSGNLTKFKSVIDEEVYDTEGGGENAWFESRLGEFDIVLQDFCEVVGHYDNTLSPPHERKYFRKVLPAGVEPIPSGEVCELDSVDSPWTTSASECVLLDPKGNTGFSLSPKLALLVPLIVSTLALSNYY